jgi:hypothetical protein
MRRVITDAATITAATFGELSFHPVSGPRMRACFVSASIFRLGRQNAAPTNPSPVAAFSRLTLRARRDAFVQKGFTMKTMLSALAIGAALALTGAGVSTADAASTKKAQTVQGATTSDASQATEFSSRHRHWHRRHHYRGPRYGYGPRYYAPRPAYGYGYGRPYGYGYGGGPGITFSFGGGRW